MFLEPEEQIPEPERPSRASTVPVSLEHLTGITNLESKSGVRVSYAEQGNSALIMADSPNEIACFLYVIETQGRHIHRPLSAIEKALDFASQQRFTIADKFWATPVYSPNLKRYCVELRPIDNATDVPRMASFAPRFTQKGMIEIVRATGSNPTIRDVRQGCRGPAASHLLPSVRFSPPLPVHTPTMHRLSAARETARDAGVHGRTGPVQGTERSGHATRDSGPIDRKQQGAHDAAPFAPSKTPSMAAPQSQASSNKLFLTSCRLFSLQTRV